MSAHRDNTAQFSEVERSGTQENCGGIGSGCRLRLRPLPVLRRRQSQRVARIDPNAVVVDKNIAENDRFDLFSRQLVCRDLVDLLFFERGEKTFHPCVVEAMSGAAEALYHAAVRQLGTKGYKDTGYAVIYKVTESVLTELFGHPPSLYLPPCTQYLTKKGAVVDAPLIQVDRKDRGSPRK